MLAGARLAGIWHHSRAHRFFTAARWSADQLGLGVLEMIVACLLAADAPLVVVVDDTLFRRSGRKVWGAAWHHDPLGKGGKPELQLSVPSSPPGRGCSTRSRIRRRACSPQ